MKKLLCGLLTCSFLLLLNVTTWAVGDDVNFSLYGDLTLGATSEKFQIQKDVIDSFQKNKGAYAGLTLGSKLEMYNFLCGGELNLGGMAADSVPSDIYDKANVNLKLYCGLNVYETDELRIAVTGSYLGMIFGDDYSYDDREYIHTLEIVGLGVGSEFTYMLTDNLSLEGYFDVALVTLSEVTDADSLEDPEIQEEHNPLLMFYGVKMNYLLSDNVALYGGVKAYVASFDYENGTSTRRVDIGYSGVNMGLSFIF